MIKLILIALLVIPLSSCIVAWRGTVNWTSNKAETDATIHNKPKAGDTHINAEKTTDAKVDANLTKDKPSTPSLP